MFAQLIVGVYNDGILIVSFYSLLLRFTDDKFDPEQAATIGECVPVSMLVCMMTELSVWRPSLLL